MTDNLVTVTCPLSTLHAIVDALDWANYQAQTRAEVLRIMDAKHAEDETFPRNYVETIDDVKHYQQDAEQYQQAYNLAFNLWANSCNIDAITDADATQTDAVALSAYVPF